MLNYALKRLAVGVLVVIVASMVLFFIMQLMPGDPIRMVAGPRTPEHRILELQEQWGLNRSPHIQYFYWIRNILRGDFGTSIRSGQSVGLLLRQRLPYTLMLAVTALVLRFLIAVPLGLIAAVRSDSWLDRGIVLGSTFFMLAPGFWLGILLMLLFGVTLGWVPISGYQDWTSIILPVTTMVLGGLGGTIRVTRSEVLETAQERFVMTAYAKGVKEKAVMYRHILRNALIPVTVSLFMSLPWLIAGSVIIENVFAWPGMGRLVWGAIQDQDFPVVQGVFILITVLTVVCNTIGDIVSGMLDPRIRMEMEDGSR